MPSASADLRKRMGELFGDEVDEAGPSQFLADRGFTLKRDWTWSKEGATYDNMSQDEYDCIRFLMEEWDMGGLSEKKEG